jgi:alanine dehydrogenase
MGAEVTVLDINPVRLMPFTEGPFKARTLYSTPVALERELVNADLVIGAVLIPGALAPKLLTRAMLATMKKGSVIVDICIDQGGVAESSRPTTIAEPTYTESGVVHYCVTNMPALVPRTSTIGLTNATLGWIKLLGEKGIHNTLQTSEPMRRSLTSYKGKLTNAVIGEAVKMSALKDEEVLGLLQ